MGKGRVIIIVGIVALAALLVAFGPPPEQDGDDNTLQVMSLAAPDSIDPGVSWSSVSWQMQVNVYNGLLTFAKETGPGGTKLVPDIATSMPKITNGGRTLTFQVRRGVMFGEPLNREVRPSDLKYSIDRLAMLPSQGAAFFSVVEGFDTVMKTRKGSVKGVIANDKARTITYQLTRPDATFLYVLALPFSFAVPKGTPAEDLSQAERVPATGPYQFTEYDPARGLVLERNSAYKQWSPHTPRGNVDRIEVTLKVSDENAVTRIMQGTADAAMTAIPRSKVAFLEQSSEWRPYLHYHEVSRTTYIWMNTQVPPFNNVKVRQAVNWAIDRRAFAKLSGGAGTPTSSILPPTIPGHTGYQPYPKQDLAKARALIEESGVDTGDLIIWCMTTQPQPDYAQYLQGVLEDLGFSARTRCLDQSAYYNVVGVKSNRAQIGFGAWGADYPEGATFIDALLNGANINPDHSNNLAWYTGADKEIARIMRMLDLDARAKAWGALDRRIIEDGAWAPISTSIQRNLIGKRVGNYTFHPLYDFYYAHATVDGSGTNNAETHEHEVRVAGASDDEPDAAPEVTP